MKRKTVNIRVYLDNWKKIKIMGIKRGISGKDMVDALVNN